MRKQGRVAEHELRRNLIHHIALFGANDYLLRQQIQLTAED